MATRDDNLATVSRIRAELTALLDGMDYCLDWKDGDGWCAREVLYHLVDTPEGGVGSIIAGVLDGSRPEITILPDINNMNPERMAAEPAEALAGVLAILQTVEEAIAAVADDDFEQRTTLAHLPARGIDETRTAQSLVDGIFARHWGEHLSQLREIRDALGM